MFSVQSKVLNVSISDIARLDWTKSVWWCKMAHIRDWSWGGSFIRWLIQREEHSSTMMMVWGKLYQIICSDQCWYDTSLSLQWWDHLTQPWTQCYTWPGAARIITSISSSLGEQVNTGSSSERIEERNHQTHIRTLPCSLSPHNIISSPQDTHKTRNWCTRPGSCTILVSSYNV